MIVFLFHEYKTKEKLKKKTKHLMWAQGSVFIVHHNIDITSSHCPAPCWPTALTKIN